jgi:hypothetical protein
MGVSTIEYGSHASMTIYDIAQAHRIGTPVDTNRL